MCQTSASLLAVSPAFFKIFFSFYGPKLKQIGYIYLYLNAMIMEDMRDKLSKLISTFNQDEKSLKLIEELESRFKELMNAAFTEEDFMSDEFDEMAEAYNYTCSEDNIDEVTYFEVLWFTV